MVNFLPLLQEILRTAELYSPFTTTEDEVMNNELVGGLISNVSNLELPNLFSTKENAASNTELFSRFQ